MAKLVNEVKLAQELATLDVYSAAQINVGVGLQAEFEDVTDAQIYEEMYEDTIAVTDDEGSPLVRLRPEYQAVYEQMYVKYLEVIEKYTI